MVEIFTLKSTDNNKNLWNQYVLSDPNASIYHLWEWGEVISKTYNHKKYYLTIQKDKDIIGIMPLIHIRSNLFANKLVSLPFCEYGGPLISTRLDPSITEHALKTLSKKLIMLTKISQIDYLELRQLSPVLSRLPSLTDFTICRKSLTFELDLTREEQVLWRNLEKRTRRAIEKALRAGVEVRDVDSNTLAQYYTLYSKTQKRHGSPPHSYDFFKNIYATFKSKERLQMLLATYKRKPIAGRMVFCFNGKIYCWNSVLDKKYASLNASNLLLWHIIRWGTKNKFKILDLGRTRIEDRGVYLFKRGWGGKRKILKDYAFFSRKKQIPDPFQRKYIFLSNLWSLLPETVTKKIGPGIISSIGL